MSTRILLALSAVLAVATSSACSTVIKPTRPSEPLAEIGRVTGYRFEGESVSIREPGTPLSPSRAWQREVANYTARSLNTLLATPEDAPVARTTVTFDLGAPGVLNIGTWKTMDILLTTVLPDGRVVKSEPVTGNIDDPLEYAAYTGLGVCGTILDVGAGILALITFIPICGPPPFGPYTIFVLVGALVAGLGLNLAQSGAQYLIAASEETRWSNLFATALEQHAEDILENRAKPPPKPAAPPLVPAAPPPPSGAPPPPPLLDPAEEKPPSAEEPPTTPAPPPAVDPAGG